MMLTDRQLQSLRNLGNESEEAADEIITLRAALEALRKDAERYRWLRDKINGDNWESVYDDCGRHLLEGDALDRHIDAAMAKP